ncbi:MAG: hypothetical protein AMJ69_11515 [Gammaproteobacteria bacterium SG8_47]|nr:MAG: hypothetical protein AMJ69_11515 [Gammaproteobacteria bacterium SG8_47]
MTTPDIQVLYDGQCPLCAGYWRALRGEDTHAPLTVVDARVDSRLRREAVNIGLDVDAAVAVKVGERWLHGAEAIHATAALLQTGLAQRANALLFKSDVVTRLVYPLLTAVRRVLLCLLGREHIAGDVGDT